LSTLLFFLPLLLVYAVLAIYAERKISAFIQSRLGPMETGPYGIFQTVADLLKLIQKEDIVPTQASNWLFRLSPLLIFAFVFAGFAFIPVSSSWAGAATASGVFMLLAIVSLDVLFILLAGWSSHNKYSTLGAFRSAAQMISYEIPLALSVLAVCMVCQTLDLQQISHHQSVHSEPVYFLGIRAWQLDVSAVGGFLTWNVFQMPLLFLVWIIFFVASLAESNRAPFDLPEAESELVAGVMTEYSGFRWAIIMLGEYAMMLLVSMLGVILFFGSWNSPLPNLGTLALNDWTQGQAGTWAATFWGAFWLVSKSFVMVALQIWVRWTFPRLRVDQLMRVSWQYLTPAALLFLILCGFWTLIINS
jgi:NADH-quinone oxidoreductase subunit H